jgi:nitrogenase subunit NifH
MSSSITAERGAPLTDGLRQALAACRGQGLLRQTELVSMVVLLDVQVEIAVILPILGAVACGGF